MSRIREMGRAGTIGGNKLDAGLVQMRPPAGWAFPTVSGRARFCSETLTFDNCTSDGLACGINDGDSGLWLRQKSRCEPHKQARSDKQTNDLAPVHDDWRIDSRLI